MKRFVTIFKDNNGKTEEQEKALIDKIKEYGTVVDYDQYVMGVKAEYQEVLDAQKAELNRIKGYDVDADEYQVLQLLRTILGKKTSVYVNETNTLKQTLEEIKRENEARINKIKELIALS